MFEHTDAKSGARFERLVIDGRPFVAKHCDVGTDWTMRAMGVLGGSTTVLWRRGLLDRLPDCINQPVVALSYDPTPGLHGYSTSLLMHDVGDWLVPPGDATIGLDRHHRFIDHMATMHAAFWEGGPEIDVTPLTNRYLVLSPWLARTEAELGSDALVPRLVGQGWERFPEVAPKAAAVVMPLCIDPAPLTAALERTPLTLLHGDWKLGNLGTDDEHRTVVIDWVGSGRGPAVAEVAWYLAVNCKRLPESKDAVLDAYRSALERHGVDTEPWWDVQCALSLLGGLVQFGWEKALGGYDDELAWWEEHALGAARFL